MIPKMTVNGCIYGDSRRAPSASRDLACYYRATSPIGQH